MAFLIMNLHAGAIEKWDDAEYVKPGVIRQDIRKEAVTRTV